MSPVYYFEEKPTAQQRLGRWTLRVVWYFVGSAVPFIFTLFWMFLLLTQSSNGGGPVIILFFLPLQFFGAHLILALPWVILLFFAWKNLERREWLLAPLVGVSLGLVTYCFSGGEIGAMVLFRLADLLMF